MDGPVLRFASQLELFQLQEQALERLAGLLREVPATPPPPVEK
jgi:hypothetical protein